MGPYSRPLQHLRSDPTSRFFVVPKDVAEHALRLLAVQNMRAEIEVSQMTSLTLVVYLGSSPLEGASSAACYFGARAFSPSLFLAPSNTFHISPPR
jgi:hypothetical protein